MVCTSGTTLGPVSVLSSPRKATRFAPSLPLLS
jgi:hypothetical protein